MLHTAAAPSIGPRELFYAVSQAANQAQFSVVIASLEAPQLVLYANEALHRLTQGVFSQSTNFSLRTLLPEAELPRLDALLESLQSGRGTPRAIETLLARGNLPPIPAELSLTPVLLADSPSVVAFISDLRERKRAEEELRGSEARFQQLVASAPDAVFILHETRILYGNASAAKLLDFAEPRDLFGADLTDHLESSDPQLREKLQNIAGGKLPTAEHFELVTRRGRALEISAVALRYEGRSAALAFARDVTERKAMHSRMLQADRLAAVGMLAAGVAHEVNNPLAYLLLNLRYLGRELAKLPLPGEQVSALLKHIEDANHGAERVQTIVRDLRTFARADKDSAGPVYLTHAVEAALALADHELRHCASVRKDFEADFVVKGTHSKLEQVFLNLLINAAQAIGSGQPQEHFIDVKIRRRSPSSIAVYVRDSGPGIPAAARERIFEPFYTTKPAGVGTGLGLPICRSIVEGFGGSIRLLLTGASGTELVVELAEHPDEPAVPSSKRPSIPSQPLPSATKARLLIVDDEVAVSSMLGRFLELHYDVVTRTGGREALEYLREKPADLILCDLMMPEMSGMEFYQHVRAEIPGLVQRVVFMTGGGLLPEVSSFLSGVDAPRVDKPFDLDDLRRVLARVARTS